MAGFSVATKQKTQKQHRASRRPNSRPAEGIRIISTVSNTWIVSCFNHLGTTRTFIPTNRKMVDIPTMDPQRNLKRISFSVDTNCVNARQGIPAMNRLEAWATNDVIELITAETAQNEMFSGGSPARTEKAYSFIFSMSEISTSLEQAELQQIGQILFPSGVSTLNQRNDIDIVFNAKKYMRPLITNDGGSKSQPGGILGNRLQLATLGIEVLTPEEAVLRVEKAIEARDTHARQWAEYYKKEIPDWVGKD